MNVASSYSLSLSAVSLCALLLSACASAPPDARSAEDAAATDGRGRHEPADAQERALLKRIPTLKVDELTVVDGVKLRVGEAYDAASGYTCRDVEFPDQESSERLACGDDQGWFFAPPVGEEVLPRQKNPPSGDAP